MAGVQRFSNQNSVFPTKCQIDQKFCLDNFYYTSISKVFHSYQVSLFVGKIILHGI